MPFEPRPDGALILRQHVPLHQSLTVMALFFGFGLMFLYGLIFEDTTAVRYRGHYLGISLHPLVWDVLFLLGTVAMIFPGVYILIGLMRGTKPYVRLDHVKVTVANRPMASDISMRWDEVAEIRQFRIAHGEAITLIGKTGRKLQLSEHVFPGKGDFMRLCGVIRFRVELAESGYKPKTPSL